jgi:transcriptional regulator with XRE-family HTH domain
MLTPEQHAAKSHTNGLGLLIADKNAIITSNPRDSCICALTERLVFRKFGYSLNDRKSALRREILMLSSATEIERKYPRSRKRQTVKDGGPDPVDVHVGNRARLRRMVLGLSQVELAEKIGVSFQQIQKYERGMNRISASTLYRYADTLSVPVSFFFEEYGDEVKHRKDNVGIIYSNNSMRVVIAFQRMSSCQQAATLNFLETFPKANSGIKV